MKNWQFDGIYTADGWQHDAVVHVAADGRIEGISAQDQVESGLQIDRVKGWCVPGITNAHSHAFQYAMAATAEYLPKGKSDDSFWSWREAMYRLANAITPDQMEVVAAMLYSEMLRQGYTWVVEFHYLHHDQGGKRFASETEMSERLIAAAKRVGIGITLAPMYYRQGGFDQPANDGQQRFLFNDTDDYFQFVEKLQSFAGERVKIATGVHSLRAAAAHEVKAVLGEDKYIRHIHIAEQMQEVEQCEAVLGARPVDWLLDNVSAHQGLNLVHATHLTAGECKKLAASDAVAVLCPSTEGNLGDGFFDFERFHHAGGIWCIGSDSHVGLNPYEELRWLDYQARLTRQRRNVICQPGEDSGEVLFNLALQAGYLASGYNDTFLDAVVFDHPLLSTAGDRCKLATIVHASDATFVRGVLTQGGWRVRKGQHDDREAIARDFQRAIAELRASL